jgi:alpha-tubulin suppressor-like RCC1 family protein
MPLRPRLSPRAVARALTFLAAFSSAVAAQTISVNPGASASVNVAPNGKLTVPVVVDLTSAGALNLASLQANLTFGQARLTFDSIRVVGATGFSLTPNTANAATGSITFNAFSATALGATGTLANVYFTASATSGGTRVIVVPTAAGTDLGTNILASILTRPLDVCVAPSGRWGDVNDDGSVNIIDAQQIARFAVGLSVANSAAVSGRGDVTADASVNIIDAQQVARFAVGLSAAARVNTTVFTPPAVASVALTPNSAQTLVAGSTLQLNAVPKDAGNNDVIGCAQVTYASSATSVATVNANGVVTAVAPGTATITASSGGQSATVSVTVTAGGPSVLELVDGPDLASVAGLGIQARVRLKTSGGAPVSGTTVTFAVTSGSGFLGATTAITDADGIASVTVAPPAAGPPNTTSYSATVSGVTPLTFSVAGFTGRVAAHTCIGDGWSLRCWGDNTRGQLGNGNNTSSTSPVNISTSGITIAAGGGSISQEGFGDHTCLLDQAGAAWCWGSNTAGQLGDSTYTSRNLPTRVKTALTFVEIGTGGEHTCGRTNAGEVWCWGYNWAGQVGDSTQNNRRFAPVRVKAPSGVAFSQLSVGAYTACAGVSPRGTAGAVYCWGQNNAGQVGDGGTTHRNAPVLAAGGASFTLVRSGDQITCGLTAAGAAICWGNPANGGLGNGTVVGTASPTPQTVVGGHVFDNLHVGFQRACGVKADFTVWCWGRNVQGALGDSTLVARSAPGFASFTGTALRLGGTNTGSSPEYACGLTITTQQVFCWGGNTSGTLGDGTTVNRLIPTLVPRAGGTAGVAAAILPVEPVTYATVPVGSTQCCLQVKLRDALGAPIVGATITWTVLTGGSTFAGGLTTMTSVTDAAGLAVTTSATIGATPGITTVRASVSGNAPPPSGAAGLVRHVFVIGGVPAPASAVKISGDSAWVGGINAAVTVMPSLQVRDASNNPVVGLQVVFSPTLNSSFPSPAVVLTDANGIATLPTGLWGRTATAAGTISQIEADWGAASPLVFTTLNGNSIQPLTSCERTSSGLVYCWGQGAQGQLGNGTNTATQNTIVPVSGGLTFTSLAYGVGPHKCGLVGTAAYCWGVNEAGQLGDGTTTNRNVPTLVIGGLAFSQIAVGGTSTCGLTTSSQLYCWGWATTAGFNGVANRGRITTAPVLVNTGGVTFTKVTLADDAVCGLTASGTIHCLGSGIRGFNLDGSFDQRTTFTQATGGPWSDVSAAYLGICALNTAGKAFCAGTDQGLGALGRGQLTVISSTLTEVNGGLSFSSIGNFHFGSCGRQSSGDVYCWGSNGLGGAGVGAGSVLSPTKIGGVLFSNVRAMAFRSQCGLAPNGQLYCWGENGAGQIADGTNTTRYTPVAVLNWPDAPVAGVPVSMTPSGGNSTAVTWSLPSGATVTPLPSVTVKDKVGAAVAGVAVTFTADAGSGVVVGGTATTNASGVATITSWTLPASLGVWTLRAEAAGVPTAVFSATTHTPIASLQIVNGNNQWIPDFFSVPQTLSVQALDASNQPVNGAVVTWTISVGSGSGACLSGCLSGTGAVASVNGIAQLLGSAWSGIPTAIGTGYTLTASVPGATPVTFTVNRLPWGSNSTNNPVAAACRLLSSGQAACWGPNTFGAVGDGTNTNRTVPTTVSGGVVFASLARSYGHHQCALTAAGAAYCWGMNTAGQLGDGTTTHRNVPTLVSGGLSFSSITAGPFTTCGITTAGAMYCWGWAGNSFRGDGALYTVNSSPTLVNTGGRTFTSVAIGWRAICGLDGSGQAFCWGDGGTGQIGNGSTLNQATPVAVNTALRFTQIQAGFDQVCGVTTSGGSVACWGFNSAGQIGTGNTTTQASPFTLPQFSNAVEVRTGEGHACARTATQVWCWGSNGNGQVGDGTTTNRTTAQLIIDGASVTSLQGTMRFASCASTSQAMYCWGANVPDGVGIQRTVPTVTSWPENSVGTALGVVSLQVLSFAGPSGAPLAPAMAFRVVGASGAPVPHATVNFVVTGGGSASPTSAISDASGVVSTTWTLGGAAGTTNTLEARVTGIPAARLTATVTAAAASIVPVGIQQFFEQTGSGVSEANPRVLVKDGANAVMPGQLVNWRVISANGTVGGTSSTVSTTDAAGTATSQAIHVSAAGNTATLVGKVNGLADSVIFTLYRAVASERSLDCVRATSSMYCRGGNSFGQLGNGTTGTASASLTLVTGGLVWTDHARGGGTDHFCGLVGNSAYCWGRNDAGQLGDGTFTNRSSPTLVSGGIAFASIVVGTQTTCGVSTAGAVYCWGYGSFNGFLTGGNAERRSAPVSLPLPGGVTAAAVAVDQFNGPACIISTTNSMYCWGPNGNGEVGTGVTSGAPTSMQQVAGTWTAVTTANASRCAVNTTNQLYCWGWRGQGGVADGGATTGSQTSPILAAGGGSYNNVYNVGDGMCARTTVSQFRCWGQNGRRQVGTGINTPSPVNTPTLIPEIPNFGVAIFGGGNAYLCALVNITTTVADLYPYCWSDDLTVTNEPQWTAAPIVYPGDIAGQAPGAAVGMIAVAGNNQTATAGAAIPTTPQIRVVDKTGTGVTGVLVTFSPLDGGTMAAASTATSDANGLVTAPSAWTLGSGSGVHQLRASIGGRIPNLHIVATTP